MTEADTTCTCGHRKARHSEYGQWGYCYDCGCQRFHGRPTPITPTPEVADD